jgi:dienelactone hydrolase
MKYLFLAAVILCVTLFSCSRQQEESPKTGIHEEEITYSTDGLTMKGFLAYDAGKLGKRPGVLVVHEWWGHNEYARKRAVMLAEMGYTAFAVDMFGDGKQANHPDDAGKFAGEVMQNIESAKARFMAALHLLKSHETTDPERVAAIGYCFGGGVVLQMARMGTNLAGVVSFHGSLGTEMTAKEGDVKASVLVCHGADDTFVTEEQITAFKKEMDNAGVDYEFISYPGAKHSFTNPAADSLGKKFDLPLAYNKAADENSWIEMQTLFDRIFQE